MTGGSSVYFSEQAPTSRIRLPATCQSLVPQEIGVGVLRLCQKDPAGSLQKLFPRVVLRVTSHNLVEGNIPTLCSTDGQTKAPRCLGSLLKKHRIKFPGLWL